MIVRLEIVCPAARRTSPAKGAVTSPPTGTNPLNGIPDRLLCSWARSRWRRCVVGEGVVRRRGSSDIKLELIGVGDGGRVETPQDRPRLPGDQIPGAGEVESRVAAVAGRYRFGPVTLPSPDAETARRAAMVCANGGRSQGETPASQKPVVSTRRSRRACRPGRAAGVGACLETLPLTSMFDAEPSTSPAKPPAFEWVSAGAPATMATSDWA